ncbi:MAG: hypothetical protein OEW45_09585 [Deltaproteobacteria bacterium]|nr:hypothetical protein [Deltaproteobacteria bacterium]
MQGDRKRTNERRNILEKMVRDAFPDKEIIILKGKGAEEEYPWEDPTQWRIRIVETKKPRRRIVLFPTEEVMTDEDIPFIEIFKDAIKYARQILGFNQESYLGCLNITTTGSEFVEPKL